MWHGLTFLVIGMGMIDVSWAMNLLDWSHKNFAQQLTIDEFRSINGSGNNLVHDDWGNSFAEVVRLLAADYGDELKLDSMSGAYRPNPREISNVLAQQTPEESDAFLNDRHLTQFAWQFGQFMDHDITLITEDKTDVDPELDIDILVPCGDPTFDAEGTCDADIFMQMFRTKAFAGTGEGTGTPRNQFNDVTSYIDASNVYGADNERAHELRAFTDGLLAVSTPNSESGSDEEYLPYNANNIANEPNTNAKFFVAGDVRSCEQLGLTFMHTTFMRFHNFIARLIKVGVVNKNPTATDAALDELIYQYARVVVIGAWQKIAFQDWLPTLFGPNAVAEYLPAYPGYDATVNPGVAAIFSSGAYRLGHTLLPQRLPLRNADCSHIDAYPDDIDLKDAFFEPGIFSNTEGMIEAIAYGFSCTLANEVDTRITDAVRNFLFESASEELGIGLPLDLCAMNIQRGRDHGLPDYNAVRAGVGLTARTSFAEMSPADSELSAEFSRLYDADIDNVDLFLAALAEDHMTGGSMGELTSQIVLTQFQRFRVGDRFYYENYVQPGFLLDFINSVTLKDIIEIGTGIGHGNLQTMDANNNVFQNTEAVSIFADVGDDSSAATASMRADDDATEFTKGREGGQGGQGGHGAKARGAPQTDDKYFTVISVAYILIVGGIGLCFAICFWIQCRTSSSKRRGGEYSGVHHKFETTATDATNTETE